MQGYCLFCWASIYVLGILMRSSYSSKIWNRLAEFDIQFSQLLSSNFDLTKFPSHAIAVLGKHVGIIKHSYLSATSDKCVEQFGMGNGKRYPQSLIAQVKMFHDTY